MRSRRKKHHGGEDLEVSPFINLMVVLVTFFLGSASMFSASILPLNIPPSSSGGGGAKTSKELKLEVMIRKDSLDVGDREGGLIRRVPNKETGYDFKGLNQVMKELKARFPDKLDATVLAQTDTPYQTLISTMDAVRSFTVKQANGPTKYGDLFPNVSLGDAPGG